MEGIKGIKNKKPKDKTGRDISSINEDSGVKAFDSSVNYRKIPTSIKDKWYKYIIHSSTEAFFITDMTSKILDVNDAFCIMSGYSRKQLLGMGLYDLDVRLLALPDGKQQIAKELKEMKGYTFKPNEFTMVQHRRKDGKIIDVSVSMKYMDVMGGIYFHFNRDITEHNRLYQQIKESEDIYRTLIELGDRVGEAVVMIQDKQDIEGLQTFASEEWCRITGYNRDELLKMSFFDLVHPKYLDSATERYRRRISGYVISRYIVLYIINKNGDEIPVEVTSAYTNYQGKGAVVSYIKDITERMRLESELKQYQINLEELVKNRTAELENANKSLVYINNNRTKFIQSVVHELKTPITPIQAASEILIAELPKGPLRELATQINQGAKNLNRRVDELRDIAKNERGMMKVLLEPLDAGKVIRHAVEYMSLEADKKNLALSLEMPPNLPKVKGDRDRINQIVLNLLSNSIKYTPAGGKINVSVKKGTDELIVIVEDNGCGMTKAQIEHLFDVNPKPHNKSDGLGLGLIISKNIVELHGGRMYVESKRNKGSTFSFTIPIPRQGGKR